MGIPSFYKWLVGKYPKIVVDAAMEEEGNETRKGNNTPNGVFHNLYIDMNGIIHPYFHSVETATAVLHPPTTYDDVFSAVFDSVDAIFRMIRPTKLVFLALDGVAPRAKMNSQRAARFQRAKQAEITDADLIMLGLASHEIHFSILREDFSRNNADNQMGECKESISPQSKPHQFLNIWTLREYLKLEMKTPGSTLGLEFDIERVVDDFVFMSLFAGNDFLPGIPSIDVFEGALDLLMNIYKEEFINMGGYLLLAKEARYMNLEGLEKFLFAAGKFELMIFAKREKRRQSITNRFLRNRIDKTTLGSDNLPRHDHPTPMLGQKSHSKEEVIVDNTFEFWGTLKNNLREKDDLFRNIATLDSDKIKLDQPGWENRYYQVKFLAETMEDIIDIRRDVIEKYTESLSWILHYYYAGVCSWDWFYPYHYAPFASDMKIKNLSLSKFEFRLGVPPKPLDRLLAVLPPQSSHALPRCYQSLMTSEDSPISDLFPFDYEVDACGKRFLWQVIVKLPFIDEELIVKETTKMETFLSENEKDRNKVAEVLQFTRRSDVVATAVADDDDPLISIDNIKIQEPEKLNPRILNGVDVPLEIIAPNDIREILVFWHESGSFGRQGCFNNTMSSNEIFKGSSSGYHSRSNISDGRGRAARNLR